MIQIGTLTAKADTAAARLARQILLDLADPDSWIFPGCQLVERSLEKEYGTSRATVRTALTMLEGVGLVEYRPHKGRFIRRYTPKQIEDVYAVRALNEGYAARLAAERITDEQVGERKAALVELEEAQTHAYGDKLEEKDLQFHDLIVRASQNTPLISLLELSGLQFIIFRVIPLTGVSMDSAFTTSPSHRDIFNAVRNRDGALAEVLVKRHVENSATAVIGSDAQPSRYASRSCCVRGGAPGRRIRADSGRSGDTCRLGAFAQFTLSGHVRAPCLHRVEPASRQAVRGLHVRKAAQLAMGLSAT